jgi:4-hydroxy-3-methylbut-2-enyl diphosphate reductase
MKENNINMDRNIIVADSAGFCFGVERAVKILNETVEDGEKPIYTYGPIIHNEHVVKSFEEKGVRLYPVDEESAEGASSVESKDTQDSKAPEPVSDDASENVESTGTIVLRSHGVSKATEDGLKVKGFKIVDATCPFVKKIHRTVEEYSNKGYGIIILGNKDHPEVLGTLGWIENGDYRVVENEDDIENLDFPIEKKLCVVAQTTFRFDKFQIFVDLIRQKGYYVYALNTICSATEVRQDEARQIASKVDVMLVIGDRLSSNSRKLFEICKGQCKQTYFLETGDDLDPQTLQSIQNIGITAGASTPKNIIEEVFEKCQK